MRFITIQTMDAVQIVDIVLTVEEEVGPTILVLGTVEDPLRCVELEEQLRLGTQH